MASERTSDVYVEIRRPHEVPRRLSFELYCRIPVDELARCHARFFTLDDNGQRIYLTGGLVDAAASLAAYRQARGQS